MAKRKKNNPFFKVLGALFIIFIALFIASNSGYYESQVRNNVTLTEEGIKEFEEKVASGEKIDLEAFLKSDKEDYRSPMSNLGDNITNSLEGVITDGMSFVVRLLKSLF